MVMQPKKSPMFFVDAMLGNIAKKLRLMGFDAKYSSDIEDESLIQVAAQENRIVISRDMDLVRSSKKNKIIAMHIQGETEIDQFHEIIEDNLGTDAAGVLTFELGQIKKVHTDDRFGNGVNYTIPSESIYILLAIAFVILATSLINFVNLTTAQALKKSSEIGLRKILGSNKKTLATQNFIELGIQVFIAGFLSIWLAEVLLHQVNEMITQVSIDLKIEMHSVWFGLLLSFIIIFSAGLYPTAMLMTFNPLQVLRGKFNQIKGSKANLRNGLLIIQFVFAQVLVIVLLVFNAQFKYIETKDLGYSTNNIVAFRDFMKSRYMVDETQLNTVKSLLLESPFIEEVTYGTGGPNANFAWNTQVYTAEMGENAAINADYKHVDIDYQNMFDLKLLAGNWFSKSNYYDTTQKVLVTELLVQKLGLKSPDDAIGQRLNVNGSTGMIIGSSIALILDMFIDSFI